MRLRISSHETRIAMNDRLYANDSTPWQGSAGWVWRTGERNDKGSREDSIHVETPFYEA